LNLGGSETYGKYSVVFTKQEVCEDYVIRKLKVTESQSKISTPSILAGCTIITQFQYIRWPEDSVPQSTTGILEVANLVQKVQMTTANKPIVVMCK
jgi:protein tyrosine phosphatase